MALAAYIDGALSSLFEKSARANTLDELIRDADRARDRKDWLLAAKAYAEAIAGGSSRPGVKVQLGHALKEMGDFDGAERMYRGFLQSHPDDADIHLQLGHLFNRKGDLACALTFYERAERLAPQDADIAQHAERARHNVGRSDVMMRREAVLALVSSRKWEEARPLLRSLVAIDGEKDLIGILANVTKETGRLDEAEALYGCYLRYATAAAAPALVADCHMQFGHLHKIRGEYSKALSHLIEARDIERRADADDSDDSEVEREILVCLREIYPCFVFRG